jgi:arylsulfate sulfotransferase
MCAVQLNHRDHIIRIQQSLEQDFLQKFEAGNYPFEAPLTVLDPYGIAPLTALVLFRLPQAQAVTVCVKGKDPAGDMAMNLPAAKTQAVPVYGLYAGAATRVVLTLEDGREKELTFTTAPAPDCIHKPDYVHTSPEFFGDHVMLLAPSSASKLAAFDYAGDLRWYCTLDVVQEPKRMPNGHFVIATERLISLPYYVTGMYEFSLLGKIYKEYRYPGGVHHDCNFDSDGNVIFLTQDFNRDTVEDMIVVLDKDTGSVLKTFDLRGLIPADAQAGNRATEHDWVHCNAVWYDKRSNSISISGRNLDAIMNLDYETGAINWILGDPEKWPQDYVDKYFFTPEPDQPDFDWFYAQHSCEMTPDGDMLVFDNGAWRSKYPEKDIPAEQKFSRGVRYHMDLEKRTVRQVWEYGKERGSEFFSPHISNVRQCGPNDYVVHSGDIGNIKGVPCIKPPLFYLSKPEGKDLVYYSITTEVVGDQVVFEMRIPSTAYFRARKERLYDPADLPVFGPGQLLGSLGITPETRFRAPKTVKPMPEKLTIRVDDELDRFRFSALLPDDVYAVLALDRGDDRKAYIVPADEKDELAMCISTLRPENENERFVTISKEDLTGDWSLHLLVEADYYDLDTIVNCDK